MTIWNPGWARSLPRGKVLEVNLHYGGGGFGHPRDATATKIHRKGGQVGLAFALDKDNVLTFREMNGVKLVLDGNNDLTGWLGLEGSAKAYRNLVLCREG